MKKVLIATEKPFAKIAVDGIRTIFDDAGYETFLLEKYASAGEFYRAVAHVDALIVRSDRVTKEVIDAASNLKIVVRAGAGYDNLDLTACSQKGIVAMNTPGQNSNAVAELALGMMIYMARNNFEPIAGTELRCKKLGIHAYGNIGKLVAMLGKGFGMETYAYDPFVEHQIMQNDGVIPVDSVSELYANCHYISLHIPVTEQTRRSIGYELIASMPRGGTIINTARKEVIDEEGLLKAMTERNDLKYATDVAPDAMKKLHENAGSRFFATAKKIGAETDQANINAGLAAARQIVDFFEKGDRKFQVN